LSVASDCSNSDWFGRNNAAKQREERKFIDKQIDRYIPGLETSSQTARSERSGHINDTASASSTHVCSDEHHCICLNWSLKIFDNITSNA
jgi:hypothetical protein